LRQLAVFVWFYGSSYSFLSFIFHAQNSQLPDRLVKTETHAPSLACHHFQTLVTTILVVVKILHPEVKKLYIIRVRTGLGWDDQNLIRKIFK
jgi:hypothetical protein